nr:MAG TPA: hypothetical protein [Caudoviricetes sp.]DAV60267.1 MAG TPA: hypothetical protein [Caudoviricetes sp.]
MIRFFYICPTYDDTRVFMLDWKPKSESKSSLIFFLIFCLMFRNCYLNKSIASLVLSL